MKKKISIIIIMLICIISMIGVPLVQVNALRADDLFSNFTSDSYLLMDANSGTILYAKNPEQKMPVASICKLMTTLLTLKQIEKNNISLNDKFMTSEYAGAAEGSQAFLDAGSEYSIKELLKSVIVASANDSAIVLAEGIAGSEENFVRLMNKKASELGMKNTLYSNSTGLPKANQYSTALDTALILNEISKYSVYAEDCLIWMDEIIHPSGRKTELVNTNRLIKYYSYCKCGKTGFTDEAGYCLASIAEKDDMKLIAVTLNCNSSADRFKECMELFNYGFHNYENKLVVDKNNILDTQIRVVGGKDEFTHIIPVNNFYIVNKKDDDSDIELRYEIIEELKAPFNKGTVVGKIIILKKGVVMGCVDLVTTDSIEKQSYKDILKKIFNNWEI